jgi:type III secretion system (T3SS) inner membrane Yop/YscD-like protein
MQLRLTVIDPTASVPAVDCLVDVGADTRLSEVRSDLLLAVGRDDGRFFFAAQPLADDAALGLPPLLDGAVVSVERPLGQPPNALLELHVTGGPDAGAIQPLGSGEHAIGRAIEADLRIDDPDVSRLHAVVSVGPAGVAVADLDSTNGSAVGGVPIGRSGVPMRVGDVLQVGMSLLELVAADSARARGVAHGDPAGGAHPS